MWTKKSFYNNNIWYHATTEEGMINILKYGVKADINIGSALDFGYGFYICPDLKWCQKYLCEQIMVTKEKKKEKKGYILEFEFVPEEHATKKTKFFKELDKDFATFVFRNRSRYKWHIISKCVHRYQMVGGPMSDGQQLNDFWDYKLHRITQKELFRRLLLPKENWQLLLHDQKLCDKLVVRRVLTQEGEEIYVQKDI